MTISEAADQSQSTRDGAGPDTAHYKVIIVGAGMSGISAAFHLRRDRPTDTFLVLEAQPGHGGTWRTHKYPGVRSDSDLFTFGYKFEPWTTAPIATGEEILKYMDKVIQENDLRPCVRYGHQIVSASWSDADKRWTLEALEQASGERRRFTADFLWMCQGYYRHAKGFSPTWDGMKDFAGKIIHPQEWPEGLDYHGKRVVIVGSGATAATLLPSIANDAAHVVMLQRSPTYFLTGRNADVLADTLRELNIPQQWIHEIIRKKVLRDQRLFVKRASDEPDVVRRELLEGVKKQLEPLGEAEAARLTEQAFTPRYAPWKQRIAFVPNGDLFKAVVDGKASVETGEIERFLPNGVLLKSGKTIEADIVVTATGFELSVLGDIAFSIDGKPLDFAKTVTYRGLMFTGVPNMVWVFGYLRASWTLRSDMVSEFVTRLRDFMTGHGYRKVEVRLRPEEEDMPLSDFFNTDDFNPGYIVRGLHLLPRSGNKPEWQHTQNYWTESEEFPLIRFDGSVFNYAK